MAHSYMELLPPFVPDEKAPASVPEQRQFYDLIGDLYRLAYEEPLLFVAALHADDAYPSRYKKGYGKPRLILDMRKFTGAVDGLLQAMFLLGRGEAPKLNKRQRDVLSRLGAGDLADLPAAWRWMATRDGASVPAFSHCLFDEGYPYTSEIYARLLGAPAFKKLEAWMLAQGYRRFNVYDTTASDCDLSLSVVNPAWSAEPPRGGFEYKIKHTGIAAQYDSYTQNPPVFRLCIPGGMKPYLEAFGAMDEALQGFVVERTKKCDRCGYCVQTDKTGARPLAHTVVRFEGRDYRLCNYYPGYNYSWGSIDDQLAEMLMKMLSFMDGFAPAAGGGK